MLTIRRFEERASADYLAGKIYGVVHVASVSRQSRSASGLRSIAATGLSRRIAIALKRSYACDGVSTRQHNEPVGYQEVWHYHVHVFPRYEGDNLYGSPRRNSTPEERQPYAASLRAYFGYDGS